MAKNLPANAGDVRDASCIPGSGRPPGVGNSNSLQYSCLKSPTDRGAGRATVHGVAKSQTRLKRLSTMFSVRSVQSLSHVRPFGKPWTPGLPVHHQLLEPAQTHDHRVSDAIQPYHPLSSPSPAAFNLSQHQGHFKRVSFLPEVAKVLEFQLQHQSFQ